MNTTNTQSKKYTTRHRGVLTIEMLLALPILLAMLFATLQFAMLLMSDQAISAAASIGAREAALPSATTARVEAVVNEVLDGWRFFADLEPIEIRVNGFLAAPQSAMTGDIVSVTVRVASNAAAPDLLEIFGSQYSIAAKELCHRGVARKE